MNATELMLILSGESGGALRAIGEVDAGLEGVNKSVEKHNSAIMSFGKAAASAIAVVGLGAVAASVKMAGDFQSQTERLVTNAGEDQNAIDQIRQKILSISNDTAYSTDQITEAWRVAASAGFTLAHGGYDVVSTAAKAAKSENADLGIVMTALTAAMHDYNVPVSQNVTTMNTLTNGMRVGRLTLQDLSGALGTVAPAASAAKIPLDEVVAGIATMTTEGIPAAEAATYMRHAIELLQAPTSKAKSALKDLGLGTDDLATTITHKGLLAAMEQLQSALAKKFPESSAVFNTEMAKVKAGTETWDQAIGNITQGAPKASAALSDIVGGVKGLATFQDLGGTHMNEFAKNIDSVRSQTKAAGNEVEGWKDIQGDFNQAIKNGVNQLKNVGISVGMALLPVLTPLINEYMPKLQAGLTKLGQWVTDHKQEIAKDLKEALNDVGVAINIAGTAVGFLADHFDAIKPFLEFFIAQWLFMKGKMAITNEVKAVTGGINSIIKIGSKIGSMADTGYVKLLYLGDGWRKMSGKVDQFAMKIGDGIRDFGKWAASGIANAAKTVAAWAKAAVETVAGWVAAGVKMVAQFVVWAAKAAVQAAAAAASWVASAASAVAGFVVMAAKALVQFAIMSAGALASGVSMAASFLLPLLPFILIGVAIAALVVLVVLNFGRIKSFIGTVVDDIKGFFRGLGDDVTHVWNGILGIIKTVINAVIGGIDGFISGINNMQIPSWVPGVGGQHTSIPLIPRLASGTTTSQSMLAIIGDAGKEHAVPDLAMSSLMDRAAQAGVSAATGGGGGTTNVTIHNPSNEIDVVAAIERQRWLDRYKQRGINASGAWPLGVT